MARKEYDYHMDDDRDYVFDYVVPFECPFGICDELTDSHDWCKRVSERRLESATKTLDDVSDWWPQFLSRWKFWLHEHPDTSVGDKNVISRVDWRVLEFKIDAFFNH